VGWIIVLDQTKRAKEWARATGHEPWPPDGKPYWQIERFGKPGSVAAALADYFRSCGALTLLAPRLDDLDERHERLLAAATSDLGVRLSDMGEFFFVFEAQKILLTHPDDDDAIRVLKEFMIADGADEERWLGPHENQCYIDVARDISGTPREELKAIVKPLGRGATARDVVRLEVAVRAVEDPGATWYGVWIYTMSWGDRLSASRLVLTIDGEAIEIPMDPPVLYVGPPSPHREDFIVRISGEVLGKMAAARSVALRLSGSTCVVEGAFSDEVLAKLREFARGLDAASAPAGRSDGGGSGRAAGGSL
jgi:hypothetical protein